MISERLEQTTCLVLLALAIAQCRLEESVSIAVHGVIPPQVEHSPDRAGSGRIEPHEAAAAAEALQGLDLLNISGKTWKDVTVTMEWVDASGETHSNGSRFVGKWEPEERIRVPRPSAVEKLIISIRKGSHEDKFILYELPGEMREDRVVPEPL